MTSFEVVTADSLTFWKVRFGAGRVLEEIVPHAQFNLAMVLTLPLVHDVSARGHNAAAHGHVAAH